MWGLSSEGGLEEKEEVQINHGVTTVFLQVGLWFQCKENKLGKGFSGVLRRLS